MRQQYNDRFCQTNLYRAAIEDMYAKSLVKLSKKLFITEKSTFGIMQPLWNKLSDEIIEVSTIHATLAHRITEDVEKPLRSVLWADSNMSNVKNVSLRCNAM
jgi:hypothetical protein